MGRDNPSVFLRNRDSCQRLKIGIQSLSHHKIQGQKRKRQQRREDTGEVRICIGILLC